MSTRRLIISPRASRQLDAARGWWRRNRDKAPAAFDEDIDATFALLLERPFTGTPERKRGLRRVLLERVRYYVYYRVTDEAVEVAIVWHASRRPPKL